MLKVEKTWNDDTGRKERFLVALWILFESMEKAINRLHLVDIDPFRIAILKER